MFILDQHFGKKHHGEFDEKFYFPSDKFRNRNESNNSEINELNELKYYTLYANPYGIGLYHYQNHSQYVVHRHVFYI